MPGGDGGRVRFAMVCASNMNRSMEAHKVFKEKGMRVGSYGVGAHVKLPGPTQKEPNVYDFGTPYSYILNDLRTKNEELYTRNGLLKMVERNVGIKEAPQRWQNELEARSDVVVCFEERVFEELVTDMMNRPEPKTQEPLLVINLDVKDSHEEASIAAPLALELCEMIEASEDWECEIEDIIDRFQASAGRRPLYTVCFY